MKTAHPKDKTQRDLEALNASAEAQRFEYADDWDDAALDTALDCAMLRESHSRDGYDD